MKKIDPTTMAVSKALTDTRLQYEARIEFLNKALTQSKESNYELVKTLARCNRTKQIRDINSSEVELYNIAGGSTVFQPVYRELEFGCAIVGFGGDRTKYGGLQLILGSNPPSQMDEQEHRYQLKGLNVYDYAAARLVIAGVPFDMCIENAEERGFELI